MFSLHVGVNHIKASYPTFIVILSWTLIFAQVQVWNKNTQFFFDGKPNLGKQATKDKTMNFSKESEYQAAKSRGLYRNFKKP